MASLSVRFPLQTGDSAITALARALGMLGGSAVFFGLAGAIGIRGSSVLLSLVTTPGIFLVCFSLFRLKLVVQRRASDIHLSPAGVAIAGGPNHGKMLAWRELDPSRSEIVVADESLAAQTQISIARLVLALADGDTMLLAEAQTAEEHSSLEALLASLRSSRWYERERAKAASPNASTPRILVCPSCGAVPEPVDADAVACAHCRARVPVPEELRARIRAAAQVTKSGAVIEASVAKILRQPSARDVNTRLVVVAVVGPILGLASAIVGGPGIMLVAVGVVTLALTTLVTAVGRRRAYRALVHLGAVEPEREGEPHTCRRCSAPLPRARAGAIVAACMHCGAANVLGLDLRRAAHEKAGATAELDSALAIQRRARARGYVALVVGVVLTIAGLAWREMTPPPAPKRPLEITLPVVL